MPSTSKKQWRLMARAAADKKFAKKFGIDHAVAKEFREADLALAKKDPDHYKNLPEEVGGKHHENDEESFEGKFAELFGAVTHRLRAAMSGGKDTIKVLDTPIWKLVDQYMKPNWWGTVKPKDGGHFVLTAAQPLFNFGTTTGHLIDDLDRGIKQIKAFYDPFSKALAVETNKLAKAYESAKKSTKSAEELAKVTNKAIAEYRKAMDKFHPPAVNLGNLHVERGPRGYSINRPVSRTPLQLMSKVDVQTVKRLCMMMHETAVMLDKWHDAYMDDSGPALIDWKDEAGWWDSHYPEAEDERDQVLNALPCNGEYAPYEYGAAYVEVIENTLRGMVAVLGVIADIPA